MMRDEFVRRRGWLDDADFVDVLGASSLIPGPTSTELAMHIGHRRGGWPGFLIAGLAFILPATAIVGVLAWLYVEQGSRPEIGAILAAVGPVVLAIIAHAGLGIARATVRTPLAVALVGVAILAVLLGVPEIAVLLGMGVAGLVIRFAADARHAGMAGLVALGPGLPGGATGATLAALGAAGAAVVAPLTVLLEMARVGAVLFGSGYVLVALFRSEFVERLGWITEAQLLDAVAVGQATPGPLFSTATFVGYLVSGPAGAVAATVGIFAPAFIAVAISIPLLARLQRSLRARAFLDGVNAATVGLLAVVAVQLGIGTLVDPFAVALAAVAMGLLIAGVGSAPLIAGAAVLGLVRLSLGG
jgi:chromate transporter